MEWAECPELGPIGGLVGVVRLRHVSVRTGGATIRGKAVAGRRAGGGGRRGTSAAVSTVHVPQVATRI